MRTVDIVGCAIMRIYIERYRREIGISRVAMTHGSCSASWRRAGLHTSAVIEVLVVFPVTVHWPLLACAIVRNILDQSS